MRGRPPMNRPPMERGEHQGERQGKPDGRTLAELSVTHWLDQENATFHQENGFLHISYEGTVSRVTLCRVFPFETEWEFLSVMNEDQQEIGLIRSIEDFSGDCRKILETELQRRYYAPVIESIKRVKDRYGFSYWNVCTADGEVTFTLRDTYRSILHAGEHRLIFLDVNGNRFEIPDVRSLDRKSYKKIELYL